MHNILSLSYACFPVMNLTLSDLRQFFNLMKTQISRVFVITHGTEWPIVYCVLMCR